MASRIYLRVKLGPLVSLEISGEDCKEISDALRGYEDLNKRIDSMCSDLAERVYPEGEERVYPEGDEMELKEEEDDEEVQNEV